MAKVYVLYTGGTIGCSGDPLAPVSGPEFAKLVSAQTGLGGGQVAGYKELSYTVDWTPQVLDSSSMTPADWVAIARQLMAHYADYDGFVVLHGTDTMAFSSSALSFLLAGLSKPVVLTGSQLPLSFTLNDAVPNLVGAIVLAGTIRVPEVCLYFNSLLLRGNRALKVNANQFAAFASPNLPPLGTVGTEITLNSSLVLPPPDPSVSLSNPANAAALREQLTRWADAIAGFSVDSLILYPGIQASTVRGMLNETKPPVRGLILQAFGEGNGPSNPEFLAELAKANKSGVVLMDNTQVLAGSVNIDAYQTGSGLAKAGALSAYDMTPEASLAKLIYLFGTGEGVDSIKKQMQRSLRGELTPPKRVEVESLQIS